MPLPLPEELAAASRAAACSLLITIRARNQLASAAIHAATAICLMPGSNRPGM